MRIHTFAVGLLTAAMAVQVVPGRVWGLEIPAPANAAEAYRKAYDLADRSGLAKSAPLADDVKTTPLDDQAKAVLEANKDVVALVGQATYVPTADWGDVTDMDKVLAELNRVRTVSRLMTLQARQDLAAKNADAAVDDWLATISMARHVAEMNLVVSRLVAVGVEAQALDHATAEIPALPEAARKRLSDGWAKIPPAPTGKSLILGEYAYAKRAAPKQNLNQEWVTILEPFYKAVADAADGPQVEFDKVVDAEVAKVPLNPFAKTLAPSLKRTKASLAKVDEKRAAFEAALRQAAAAG